MLCVCKHRDFLLIVDIPYYLENDQESIPCIQKTPAFQTPQDSLDRERESTGAVMTSCILKKKKKSGRT